MQSPFTLDDSAFLFCGLGGLSRALRLLIAVVCCAAFVHGGAEGLSFDVTDASTCLVYTIDSVADIPRVEIKYESNATNARGGGEGSMLSIQTLDPHRAEVHTERMVSTGAKQSKWKVARILHRDANPSLGTKGFSLAGEYTVCFRRIPNPNSPVSPADGERAVVTMLLGDPRSHRMLEKHTLATRGAAGLYTGSVRARQHRRGARNGGEGQHADTDAEHHSLSADDAEELSEWIDEVEGQLVEVNDNFHRFTDRHRDFVTTSNSLFTRVWLMSVLTMLSMAGSMGYMYKGLQRTLKAKKLV